jgi:uncharacterized protein (TIGR02147 family)
MPISNTPHAALNESSLVVEHIFEYDNYREFLKEYFEEQRKAKPFFSHRYFAQKAGFSSHSFCAYIMDGKRNLSHESIKKMVKGIGLKGKKAEFFEALVDYNQSFDDDEREKLYKVLQRIRKGTEFYKINAKQLAYYDQWFYPIIRELVVYVDWKNDFEFLGSLLRPQLSAAETEGAVKLLLEIGLIEIREDGRYYQSAQVVTAEKIPGYVFKNSRREFIRKAIEASELIPKAERNISYSILAMSHKTFDEASKLIDEVRKKILVLAMEDEQVDGVFDLNIQLFPLTQFLNPKQK